MLPEKGPLLTIKLPAYTLPPVLTSPTVKTLPPAMLPLMLTVFE